jgi:hypothetical protein
MLAAWHGNCDYQSRPQESSRAVSFSYYDSEAASAELNAFGAMGGVGGGFGSGVHTGGFSK